MSEGQGEQKAVVPVIQMQGVGLHYGEPKAPALVDLNLTVKPGSFTFITGVSGAGKTSLLNLLALNQAPTAGRLMLFGTDVQRCKPDVRARLRRDLGVVYQDFRLLEHLSVEENVALPLRLAGNYSRSERDNLLDLLTWVGLADKLKAAPSTLSGGQQQRVALARAVIARPKLLLADEPTGNLDDGMGMKLLYLFEELNRIGTTVLVATHSRAVLTSFNHPILKLESRRLVEAGVHG